MSKSKAARRHTMLMALAAVGVGALVMAGVIDPATAGVAMLAGSMVDGADSATAAAPAADPNTPADGTPAAADPNSTGQPATPGANPQTTGQPTPEVVYEFKLPDGMELDKAAVDAFIPLAKELKLSPEQAQKFADLKVQDVQRQAEAWQSQQAQWVDQVKGDAEIGGDNLEKSLAYAKVAVDFIGDPELANLLNTTGYGNHPTLVKAFVKIGKQLAPDSFVGGKREPATNSEEAALARMYPTMAKA